MSTTETFYVCRNCAPGKTVDELRAYRPIVSQDDNVTRWDCPECGANILISIDGGTLDLGLVRDEQLEDADDFWVYTPER